MPRAQRADEQGDADDASAAPPPVSSADVLVAVGQVMARALRFCMDDVALEPGAALDAPERPQRLAAAFPANVRLAQLKRGADPVLLLQHGRRFCVPPSANPCRGRLTAAALAPGSPPAFAGPPPAGEGVRCHVLLNCPVEQNPARKSHGRSATVDYPGRYFASFALLCSLGIFPHTAPNKIDRTLRWTHVPGLAALLADPAFPRWYCRDDVGLYKIVGNKDTGAKTMVLALSVAGSGCGQAPPRRRR